MLIYLETGMYYIGVVDSTFNAGRLRQGEANHRNYSLKMWWGQCMYWNSLSETWRTDGCYIKPTSSLQVSFYINLMCFHWSYIYTLTALTRMNSFARNGVHHPMNAVSMK